MSLQSSSIMELAKALAPAQAELVNAKKESSGNYGKYADLGQIRDIVTPVLSKHKLSILQIFESDELGQYLITMLVHESGEWIKSRMRLNIEKPTMQGLGSAITYARRYALAAITNIAQEDDDGQLSENEATPHLRPQASDGTYRFTFGKFDGKTFSEIPPKDLASYIMWLRATDAKKPGASRNEHIYRAYEAYQQNGADENHEEGADDPDAWRSKA